MPTVFIRNGIRFFFYSNENAEPAHVHVSRAESIGKIWLEPTIKLAYMRGFSQKEVNQVLLIIKEEIVTLKARWNEYFK